MVIINDLYNLRNRYTINMIYPLNSNRCRHLLNPGNRFTGNMWVDVVYELFQFLIINLSNLMIELMLIINFQILVLA